MCKDIKIEFGSRELKWKSNGIDWHLYQHNGLDIALGNSLKKEYFSPYSSPSHELFTSLLRFLYDQDVVPSLEEIQHINDNKAPITNYFDGYNGPKIIIMENLEYPLPERREEDVFIRSMNFGMIGAHLDVAYFGYQTNEKYVIAKYADTGRKIYIDNGKEIFSRNNHVQDMMELNATDALITMKGIYHFSGFNSMLDEIYSALPRIKK